MNAPPVQYVTTSDGYSIAYTVSGEGRPFVQVPNTFHHLHLVWQDDGRGRWLESLASRYRLVTFDTRGTGLSTRGLPSTFTVQDWILDLEAVADRVGSRRFVLLGNGSSVHTAVRYAAKHPDRVEALILISPNVTADAALPPSLFEQRPNSDWDTFLNVLTQRAQGREAQDRDVANLKRMVDPQDFALMSRSFFGSSIDAELRQISAPTLVIQKRESSGPMSKGSAEVASRISEARIVTVEGGGTSDAFLVVPDSCLAAIEDFLADLPPPGSHPAASASSDALPDGLSDREG